MNWLQKFTNNPFFFYIISHERSGTHFLINCIQLNSPISLKYKPVGEWFGPFNQPQKRFDHIHEQFRSLKNNKYYILKSHCDRDLFEKCYRTGKVIYIFRDYRDVLTSYYNFLKGPYLDWARKHNPNIKPIWFSNFSEFIHMPVTPFLRFNYSLYGSFSNPIERWKNHVSGWIVNPPSNVFIITYNQLYLDPEGTTKRLMNWLDLPVKKTFTFPDLKNNYSIAPRKGIIGDWKNQIGPEDLAFLETKVADLRPQLNNFSWESESI